MSRKDIKQENMRKREGNRKIGAGVKKNRKL